MAEKKAKAKKAPKTTKPTKSSKTSKTTKTPKVARALTSSRYLGVYGKLLKSVWVFPVVLFLILCVFTILKISGTSVGIYHNLLYGSTTKDSGLIYGQPQPIRSDEWGGGTQIIIAQSRDGFPKVNPDMSGGQNLSLQADTPTKDWPTVFKPQLWSFFIMPLENAFAFKWWFVMYMLVVSCYFFTLRVLNGRKLFAIIFSLAIGLSPFELWWYQSDGFLTLAYGFLLLILVMRVLNGEPVRFIKNKWLSSSIYVLILAFLMCCFGLLFYPPFQIPVAIVMLFFVVGLILHKRFSDKLDWKNIGIKLLPIVGGVIIAGIIGMAFIFSHRAVINALGQSVYPGHRYNGSGGMVSLQVLDAFVMPAEQSAFRGAHFFTNQSESANFILLLPFLVIPGFFILIYRWFKTKYIDWVLLFLQLCGLMFFVRAFTTFGDPLFKLLLLNRVPNNARLLIGIGFLGIVQLIYLIKNIGEAEISYKLRWLLAFLYGIACFVVLMMTGSFIRVHYPQFLDSWHIITGLALAFSAITVLFLADLKLLAASLLLLFTMASSFKILPLYKGLGVLTNSNIINTMDSISSPSSTWVTVGSDASVYANFGIIAGRGSLSGAQIYPTLDFWSKVGGTKYKNVYNREAHAFFLDDSKMVDPIALSPARNVFYVKFQCSNFITSNAEYALSVHPLKYPCISLAKTVVYPQVTFYLYKISP